MIWLPVVMAGGALYAGGKALRRLGKPQWLARHSVSDSDPLVRQADNELALSVASLGVATAGSLLKLPLLGWLSFPVSLYLFVPVVREAGEVLGKQHRINDQVLTTTRLAVCATMGYTFIAALDAGLHTLTQRMQVRNEAVWRRILRQRLGTHEQALCDWLERTSHQPTYGQQVGERSGAVAAPLMLATCVLTTPVLGINRSSAFLTTFFGAHLRKLGPYTARECMLQVLEQGALLTHPHLLDRAAQVDTLVFDGYILQEPQAYRQFADIVPVLRQQQRTIYVFAATDAGACQIDGVDACFNVITEGDRAELICQWQAEGKTVCYVSSGEGDSAVLCAADLPVIQRRQALQVEGLSCVLLVEGDIRPLPGLLVMAGVFAQRQRFNLLTPIGVDMVDISTTLLLDFGLVYSVMFTYIGLLLGMARTDLPFGTVVKNGWLVSASHKGN